MICHDSKKNKTQKDYSDFFSICKTISDHVRKLKETSDNEAHDDALAF